MAYSLEYVGFKTQLCREYFFCTACLCGVLHVLAFSAFSMGGVCFGALNFGDRTSAGVLLTAHLPQKDWRSRIYPRASTIQSQASRPTRASRRLHILPLNVHNIMLLAEATRRILSTSFVFESPRRPNLLLYLFRNGPISDAPPCSRES